MCKTLLAKELIDGTNIIEAQKMLQDVVQSDPGHSPALISLAQVLLRQGAAEKAIDLTQKALSQSLTKKEEFRAVLAHAHCLFYQN